VLELDIDIAKCTVNPTFSPGQPADKDNKIQEYVRIKPDGSKFVC
jgi:hypothetical protein